MKPAQKSYAVLLLALLCWTSALGQLSDEVQACNEHASTTQVEAGVRYQYLHAIGPRTAWEGARVAPSGWLLREQFNADSSTLYDKYKWLNADGSSFSAESLVYELPWSVRSGFLQFNKLTINQNGVIFPGTPSNAVFEDPFEDSRLQGIQAWYPYGVQLMPEPDSRIVVFKRSNWNNWGQEDGKPGFVVVEFQNYMALYHQEWYVKRISVQVVLWQDGLVQFHYLTHNQIMDSLSTQYQSGLIFQSVDMDGGKQPGIGIWDGSNLWSVASSDVFGDYRNKRITVFSAEQGLRDGWMALAEDPATNKSYPEAGQDGQGKYLDINLCQWGSFHMLAWDFSRDILSTYAVRGYEIDYQLGPNSGAISTQSSLGLPISAYFNEQPFSYGNSYSASGHMESMYYSTQDAGDRIDLNYRRTGTDCRIGQGTTICRDSLLEEDYVPYIVNHWGQEGKTLEPRSVDALKFVMSPSNNSDFAIDQYPLRLRLRRIDLLPRDVSGAEFRLPTTLTFRSRTLSWSEGDTNSGGTIPVVLDLDSLKPANAPWSVAGVRWTIDFPDSVPLRAILVQDNSIPSYPHAYVHFSYQPGGKDWNGNTVLHISGTVNGLSGSVDVPVHVLPVNDPPVYTGPVVLTTSKDSPFATLDFRDSSLASDLETSNSNLRFSFVVPNGVISQWDAVRRTLSLTPPSGFVGTISPELELRISDRGADGGGADLTTTARIRLVVEPMGFSLVTSSPALVQPPGAGVLVGSFRTQHNTSALAISRGRLALTDYPGLFVIATQTQSESSVRNGEQWSSAYQEFQIPTNALVFNSSGQPVITLDLLLDGKTRLALSGTWVSGGYSQEVSFVGKVDYSGPAGYVRAVSIDTAAGIHQQLVSWSVDEDLSSLQLEVTNTDKDASDSRVLNLGADSTNLQAGREHSLLLPLDGGTLVSSRTYVYTLRAIDRRGNRSVWVDSARTGGDLHTVSGQLQGVSGNSIRISLGQKVIVVAPGETLFTFEGVSDGIYTLSVSGEGITATPEQQTVTVLRQDVSGLSVRITQGSVLAAAPQVFQEPGSGDLLLHFPVSGLFPNEHPSSILLKWKGSSGGSYTQELDLDALGYASTTAAIGIIWSVRVPHVQMAPVWSGTRDLRLFESEIRTQVPSVQGTFRASKWAAPEDSLGLVRQVYRAPQVGATQAEVTSAGGIAVTLGVYPGNPGAHAMIIAEPEDGGLSEGTRTLDVDLQSAMPPLHWTSKGESMVLQQANWLGALPQSVAAAATSRFVSMRDKGRSYVQIDTAGAADSLVWNVLPSAVGRAYPWIYVEPMSSKGGRLAVRWSLGGSGPDTVVHIPVLSSGWVPLFSSAQSLASSSFKAALGDALSDSLLISFASMGIETNGEMIPFVIRLEGSQQVRIRAYGIKSCKTNTCVVNRPADWALSSASSMGWYNTSGVWPVEDLLPDTYYRVRVQISDAFGNHAAEQVFEHLKTGENRLPALASVEQDPATGDYVLRADAAALFSGTSGTQHHFLDQVSAQYQASGYQDFPAEFPAGESDGSVMEFRQFGAVLDTSAAFGNSESHRFQLLYQPPFAFCSDTSSDEDHGDDWFTHAMCSLTMPKTLSLPALYQHMSTSHRLPLDFRTPLSPTATVSGALEPYRIVLNLSAERSAEQARPAAGRLYVSWTPGSACAISSDTTFEYGAVFQPQDDGAIRIIPNLRASWSSSLGKTDSQRKLVRQWVDAVGDLGGTFLPDYGPSDTLQVGNSNATAARLSMAFRVPNAGNYRLMVLGRGPTSERRRHFHWGIDSLTLASQALVLRTSQDVPQWEEGPLVSLDSGRHTVDLFMQDPGVAIARIAIVPENYSGDLSSGTFEAWTANGFHFPLEAKQLRADQDITFRIYTRSRFGIGSEEIQPVWHTPAPDLPLPDLAVQLPGLRNGELSATPQPTVVLTAQALSALSSGEQFDTINLQDPVEFLLLRHSSNNGTLQTDTIQANLARVTDSSWTLQPASALTETSGDLSDTNGYQVLARLKGLHGFGNWTSLRFALRDLEPRFAEGQDVQYTLPGGHLTLSYVTGSQLSTLPSVDGHSQVLVKGEWKVNLGLGHGNVAVAKPGYELHLNDVQMVFQEDGQGIWSPVSITSPGRFTAWKINGSDTARALQMPVKWGRYTVYLQLAALHLVYEPLPDVPASQTGTILGISTSQQAAASIVDDAGYRRPTSSLVLGNSGILEPFTVSGDRFRLQNVVRFGPDVPGFHLESCHTLFHTAGADSFVVEASGRSASGEDASGCAVATGPWLDFDLYHPETDKDAYRFFHPLDDTVDVTFQASALDQYLLPPDSSWATSGYADSVFYDNWRMELRHLTFSRAGGHLDSFDVFLAPMLRNAVGPDSVLRVSGLGGSWATGRDTVNHGRLHIFGTSATSDTTPLWHARVPNLHEGDSVVYRYHSKTGWTLNGTSAGHFTVSPTNISLARLVLPTAGRGLQFPWDFSDDEVVSLPIDTLAFNATGWQRLHAKGAFAATSGALHLRGVLEVDNTPEDYRLLFHSPADSVAMTLVAPNGSTVSSDSINFKPGMVELDPALYLTRLESPAGQVSSPTAPGFWPIGTLPIANTRTGTLANLADPVLKTTASQLELTSHEGWPVLRLVQPRVSFSVSLLGGLVGVGNTDTTTDVEGVLLDGYMRARQFSANWKMQDRHFALPADSSIGLLGFERVAVRYRPEKRDFTLDLHGNFTFGSKFSQIGLGNNRVQVDTCMLSLQSPVRVPAAQPDTTEPRFHVGLEKLSTVLEGSPRTIGISPKDLGTGSETKDFVEIHTGQRPFAFNYSKDANQYRVAFADIGLVFTDNFPFRGFRRVNLDLDTLVLAYQPDSLSKFHMERLKTSAVRHFDSLDLFRTSDYHLTLDNATLSASYENDANAHTSKGYVQIGFNQLDISGRKSPLTACPGSTGAANFVRFDFDGGLTTQFCAAYNDIIPLYKEDGEVLVGMAGPVQNVNLDGASPQILRNPITLMFRAQAGGTLDPMLLVGATADFLFRDPADKYPSTLGWMEPRLNGQLKRVTLSPGMVSFSSRGLLLERLHVDMEPGPNANAYISWANAHSSDALAKQSEKCSRADNQNCGEMEQFLTTKMGPLGLTVDTIALDYWRTKQTDKNACSTIGTLPGKDDDGNLIYTPDPLAKTGCMQISVANHASFDMFENCNVSEWNFRLSLGGKVDQLSSFDLDLEADKGVSATCQIAGLQLDAVGMTFTKKKDSRAYYGLFADRLQLTANRPEVYRTLGAEKPVYLRFDSLMVTSSTGISNLNPNHRLGVVGYDQFTLGPRDAYLPDTARLEVLGLKLKAKVEYEHLFADTWADRGLEFQNVEVQTGSVLGNAHLSTGFSLLFNGRKPYIHPKAGSRLALRVPTIQLSSAVKGGGELVYERKEVPSSSSSGTGSSSSSSNSSSNKEYYWTLNVKGNVAIPSFVKNASIDIAMVKPDKINVTGIEHGIVTVELTGASRIPLGTTGLYITGLMGGIYDGYGQPSLSQTCKVGTLPPGLKAEMAVFLQDANYGKVLDGQIGVWVQMNALNFGIDGKAKLMQMVDAKVCAALMNDVFRARASAEVDKKLYARGDFGVDVWSDSRGKNIAGSASAEVGISRGALYRSRWFKIPSSRASLGKQFVNFGRFTNGKNGFTTGFRFWGKSWGAGIIGGSFKLGGIGGYKLASPPGGMSADSLEQDYELPGVVLNGGEYLGLSLAADTVPFSITALELSIGGHRITIPSDSLEMVDNQILVSFDNTGLHGAPSYEGQVFVRLGGLPASINVDLEAFTSLPVPAGSLTASLAQDSLVTFNGSVADFPFGAFEVLNDEDPDNDADYGYQFLEPVLLSRKAIARNLNGQTVELDQTLPADTLKQSMVFGLGGDGASSTSSTGGSSSSDAYSDNATVITLGVLTRESSEDADTALTAWAPIPLEAFLSSSSGSSASFTSTLDYLLDLGCVTKDGPEDAYGRATLKIQDCKLWNVPANGGIREFALGMRVWDASILKPSSSSSSAITRAAVVEKAMARLDSSSVTQAIRSDGNGNFYCRLEKKATAAQPVTDLEGFGSGWNTNWYGEKENRKAYLRWKEQNSDNSAVDGYRVYWKVAGTDTWIASAVVPKGGSYDMDFPDPSDASLDSTARLGSLYTANTWTFLVTPVKRMRYQSLSSNAESKVMYVDADGTALADSVTFTLSSGKTSASNPFRLVRNGSDEASRKRVVVPLNRSSTFSLGLDVSGRDSSDREATPMLRWTRMPSNAGLSQASSSFWSTTATAVDSVLAKSRPLASVTAEAIDLARDTSLDLMVQPKLDGRSCREMLPVRPFYRVDPTTQQATDEVLMKEQAYILTTNDPGVTTVSRAQVDSTTLDFVDNGNDPSQGLQVVPDGSWVSGDTVYRADECRSAYFNREDSSLLEGSPLGLYSVDMGLVHDSRRLSPDTADTYGDARYKTLQVLVAPPEVEIAHLSQPSLAKGLYTRLYLEAERSALLAPAVKNHFPDLVIRDTGTAGQVRVRIHLDSSYVVPVREDTTSYHATTEAGTDTVITEVSERRNEWVGLRVSLTPAVAAQVDSGKAVAVYLEYRVPTGSDTVRVQGNQLLLDVIAPASYMCPDPSDTLLTADPTTVAPDQAHRFANLMAFLGTSEADTNGFRLVFSELHHRVPEHWVLDFLRPAAVASGTVSWTFNPSMHWRGDQDLNPYWKFRDEGIYFRFPPSTPDSIRNGGTWMVRPRLLNSSDLAKCGALGSALLDPSPVTLTNYRKLSIQRDGDGFRILGVRPLQRVFYTLSSTSLTDIQRQGLKRYYANTRVTLPHGAVVSAVGTFHYTPLEEDENRVQTYLSGAARLNLVDGDGLTVTSGQTVDFGKRLFVQPLGTDNQPWHPDWFSQWELLCSWDGGDAQSCSQGVLPLEAGTHKLNVTLHVWPQVSGKELEVLSLAAGSWTLTVPDTRPLDTLWISCSDNAASLSLENYPLWIDLSASLRDSATRATVLAAGGFHFRDADGQELDYEVESFDTTTGLGYAWVRVPHYGGTCTKVLLYPGVPSEVVPGHGVWNSTYTAVWHLDADSLQDRVAGNQLEPGASSASFGHLYLGLAVDSMVALPVDRQVLDPTGDAFTYSLWMRMETLDQPIRLLQAAGTSDTLSLVVESDSSVALVWTQGDSTRVVARTLAGTVEPGSWFHVALVVDRGLGSSVLLMVNGNRAASGSFESSWQLPYPLQSLSIQAPSADGLLVDELRLNAVALSTDWLLTDYLAQRSGSFSDRSDSASVKITDLGCPGKFRVSGKTRLGDAFYNDRDFRIAGLPSFLLGSDWMQTTQSDKASTEDPYVCFQVDRNANLYLLVDTAYSQDPTFLSNWTPVDGEALLQHATVSSAADSNSSMDSDTLENGMVLQASLGDLQAYEQSHEAFRVYRRHVGAGSVLVPGPRARGGSGNRFQYALALQASDSVSGCVEPEHSTYAWVQENAQVGQSAYGEGDQQLYAMSRALLGTTRIVRKNSSVRVTQVDLSTCRSAVVYLAIPVADSTPAGWELTGYTVQVARDGDVGTRYRVFRHFHDGGRLQSLLQEGTRSLQGNNWFVFLSLSGRGDVNDTSVVDLPDGVVEGPGSNSTGDASPELEGSNSLVLDSSLTDPYLVLRFHGPVRVRLALGSELAKGIQFLQGNGWSHSSGLRWKSSQGDLLQVYTQEFLDEEENAIVVPTPLLDGYQMDKSRWILFYEMLEPEYRAYQLNGVGVRSLEQVAARSTNYTLTRADIKALSGSASGAHYSLQVEASAEQQSDSTVARTVIYVRNPDSTATESDTGTVHLTSSAPLVDVAPFLVNAEGVTITAIDLEVTGEAEISLTNNSANDIRQPFLLQVYEDLNGNYLFDPDSDRYLGERIVTWLPAGQVSTFQVSLGGSYATHTTPVLLAVSDPSHWLNDTDRSNDVVALQPDCRFQRTSYQAGTDDIGRPLYYLRDTDGDSTVGAGDQVIAIQEVAEGYRLVDAVSGTQLATIVAAVGETYAIRDLDGDGRPEWIFPNRILSAMGGLILDARSSGTWLGQPLVDLNADGYIDALTTAGSCPVFQSGLSGISFTPDCSSGSGSLLDVAVASSGTCSDAAISYPRNEEGPQRTLVRLSNGGSDPLPVGMMLEVWASGVRIAEVPVTEIPLPGRFVDLEVVPAIPAGTTADFLLRLPAPFGESKTETLTRNNHLRYTAN